MRYACKGCARPSDQRYCSECRSTHGRNGSTRAWRTLRRAVVDRDGQVCAECGSPGPLEVHHLTPKAEGGPDLSSNLVTLCAECHDAQ